MNALQWSGVFLSFTSVVVIPILVIMIRGIVKWTKVEQRLEEITNDLREIVAQGRDDRAATDRRLRWLEENLWRPQRKGNGNAV